ncbi:MAG TPA: tetratricopeptide repeat protein [Polyangia bacterium]
MPLKLVRLRHAASAVGLGLVLAVAGAARAAEQDDGTLNKVVELNKKALTLYESLDMEGAAALLTQALELCTSAHLDGHPTAARTHVHLGVVYVSGLKNRRQGLAELRQAIAIDPKIKITKSLINPEVQAAFAEVQALASTPALENKPLPFPTGQKPVTQATPGESVDYEITHPVVTEAMRNQAVAIKAQVPPGLGAARVMLAYRAEDGDEFLARDMLPLENATSWFQAEIPIEATRGKEVAYYIEAQNADDQALSHSGTPEAPHRIVLASDSPTPNNEDNEDNEDKATPPVPKVAKEDDEASSGPGLWFVLAAGSGGGYHSGSPEMNPEDTSTPPKAIHVSGFGAAQLLHLAPEIGYFHNDQWILSAQGRFQFVTGAQESHVGQKTSQPARMAYAGLVKATRVLGSTNRKLQPFFSVQAGAGQIRQSVKTPASANLTGCGGGPTCKVTVLGGVGLAGVGTGLTYKLNETFRLYAALNVLAGLPDFMVEADVNVGLAITR